jgi:hypothetical protein
MTSQPPTPSLVALPSSPTSALPSQPSRPAPALSVKATVPTVAPASNAAAPAIEGAISPTFRVLQSLALALALPLPHIRSLRDGSAAVGGPDAPQGFAAVASVVGAAVCVLVSSAGGCCSAQLPLTLAATADERSDRAREEAWRQVRSAKAYFISLQAFSFLSLFPAAVAASTRCHQPKLHQRSRSYRPFGSCLSRQRASAGCPVTRPHVVAAGRRRAAGGCSHVHLQVPAQPQIEPNPPLVLRFNASSRSTLHGAPVPPSHSLDVRRQVFKFSIRVAAAAAPCNFSCAVMGGSLLVQSVLGSRSGSGSLSIAAYVAPGGSIKKPGALVHSVALQLLRPLFVMQCGGPGVSLADLPHEVLVLVCDQLPPRHAALLARCSRSLCSASSSSLAQRRQKLQQQAAQQRGQTGSVRSRWGGSGHWVDPPVADDHPSPYWAWLGIAFSRNIRRY